MIGQGSGAGVRHVRRERSVLGHGPASATTTTSIDDLDGAREADMGRKERRDARRARQAKVRRARNRARLRRGGFEIPPELQEPGEEPEPEPEDTRDPEIEPRAEPKMRRGPIEDKMLRPHEVGAEDKEQAGPPDDDADDGPGGLDSVEFGSPAARELAEEYGPGPLELVEFGSAAARELAEAEGLDYSSFAGRQPSGATGFVLSDVRAIVDETEP